MNTADTVRSWLFKGLTAETRLDAMETEGMAVKAATSPGALQRVMSLEDFSPEIRHAAMTALPVYLAFFCLENSIRELAVSRLAEDKGAGWRELSASSAIKKKVNERQQKEGANRWHERRGASEIYYTDFGDLASIIQGNWAQFEDLFPDQNWITNRLSELEASRNIVAHSNVLDDREIARVRMYLQDWVRQVG